MTKLRDICRFQSGGTPSRGTPAYFNGNIPWITTVALNGDVIDGNQAIEWITDEAIAKSAAKIVPPHSVMIGTRVGIGKVAINSVPMSTSQDIISLIGIDENKWDKKFICHLITANKEHLNSQARGATIKGIKIEVIADLVLPEISVKEQARVSEIIGKVDALICMQQQMARILDQLIKSRFIELFASVEAEDTLQNLCTFIDYRGKTPEKAESGLPFITAKNIRMHRMSFDTLEYISKETYDRVMTRGFPQIGDVVFTTEAPLGNVCRIPFIETEFYIGQRIITMQTERLEPAYLEYALSSNEFKRKIAEKSSGSTVTGIRSKLLEQLTIPVPPRALQEQFAAFVEQTDKSKLCGKMEVAA